MSFLVHYCYGEKEEIKIKEEERKMEEDGEEFSNNNCGITFWVLFNSSEYDISSFEEYISRELLTGELDLISCKVIWSRGKLKILYLLMVNTVTSILCSIAIGGNTNTGIV